MTDDDIFADVDVVEAPKVEPPKIEEKAVDTQKTAEILLDKLFLTGKIVRLTIGYWRAKKKLKPKDLGLKEKDVPNEIFSLGQKRLIKKSSLDEIQSIEGKARSLVEDYSTESWIEGLRFMTQTSANKVKVELTKLQKEFHVAVDEFVKNYPKLKQEMLDEFPQYADALKDHYPTVEQVKKRAKFKVRSFKAQMVKPEVDILAGAKAEIKQTLMDELNAFLQVTVEDQRNQFIEHLEFVKNKLDSGEKVHGKTVKKIHDMIALAKEKNFINDKQFFSLLDKFKKDFDKETANDPKTQGDVKKQLEVILSSAKEAKDAPEVVEQYKRSILV